MSQNWIQNNWFKVIFLVLVFTAVVVFSIYTYKYKNPLYVTVPVEPRIVQVFNSTSTPQLSKRLDLPTIIQEWYPGIVRVECYIKNSEGEITVQNGSGLLLKEKQDIYVLTNKHVISLNNQMPELCAVGLVNSLVPHVSKGQVSEGEEPEIFISKDDLDWGYIKIMNPDDSFQKAALADVKFCKSKPILGAGIAIMGYPEVGSQTDITVTQGIVSGYDDPYFITDAKIGSGNSGGVAIQTEDVPKNSCMLGIPTFAQIGEVVNLGRILDIQRISLDTWK